MATNRKFEVLHLQVGPFKTGNVFDDAMFRSHNKLPPDAAGADAYYQSLTDRLVSLGAVREVPESTPVTTPDLGPENKPEPPKAVVADKADVLAASGAKSEPEPRKAAPSAK